MGYADVIGQEQVITQLKAFCDFYTHGGRIPGHIFLTGDDGMGKRTIAKAFASEASMPFQAVSAEDIRAIGDLTALLTNLSDGQMLCILNIPALRREQSDILCKAVRHAVIDITIGAGKTTRAHRLEIKPFTLFATANSPRDCPADVLRLFSLAVALRPYSLMELEQITTAIAKKNHVLAEPAAVHLIATNSSGTPHKVELLFDRLKPAISTDAIFEQLTLSEEGVLRAFSAFGISSGPIAHGEFASTVHNLSGIDFERFVAVLLTRMGFRTEMTKATGDEGIDVVAFLDKPIVGGKYLFQCKRFSPDHLVGSPTVRDFYGAVIADRAVKGIFITTSDFTIQARDFGHKVGLELIGWKELQTLIAEYKVDDGLHHI